MRPQVIITIHLFLRASIACLIHPLHSPLPVQILHGPPVIVATLNDMFLLVSFWHFQSASSWQVACFLSQELIFYNKYA